MSDFFDNESEIEEKTEAETEEKKPKKKNDLKKIVAYVLCLAIIIGGCALATLLIPKKKKASSLESSEGQEIKVLSLKPDSVKKVTVESKKGTLRLYNEGNKWYVDGVKKECISTDKTELIIDAATEISAIKEVTGKVSEVDCGFDKPEAKAEILTNKDKVISVLIGKSAPFGESCYLKRSDTENIYVVENGIKDKWDKNSLELTENNMPAVSMSDDITEYFKDGQLNSCDSITVTGKNYPQPLVVVPNDDSSKFAFIPYVVKSPDNHLADKVDKIFEWFGGGVSANGAYSYDANDFSKYGLNDPDITLSMQLKNKTHVFKLAKQEDGTYAGWCSARDTIYKINVSDADENFTYVLNSKATDFYMNLVFLYSIDDLTDFVIKDTNNTYSFSVKANSDKDSSDKYIVKSGDKKINSANFQNLYEYVLNLSYKEYDVTNPKQGEKITVEFHLKDGTVKTTEFIRVSDLRFEPYENGKALGRVASADLYKMVKYAKALVNGETLPSLG